MDKKKHDKTDKTVKTETKDKGKPKSKYFKIIFY